MRTGRWRTTPTASSRQVAELRRLLMQLLVLLVLLMLPVRLLLMVLVLLLKLRLLMIQLCRRLKLIQLLLLAVVVRVLRTVGRPFLRRRADRACEVRGGHLVVRVG